jgi:hypothetical protein
VGVVEAAKQRLGQGKPYAHLRLEWEVVPDLSEHIFIGLHRLAERQWSRNESRDTHCQNHLLLAPRAGAAGVCKRPLESLDLWTVTKGPFVEISDSPPGLGQAGVFAKSLEDGYRPLCQAKKLFIASLWFH